LNAKLLVLLQMDNIPVARETILYMESIGIKVDPQLRKLIK
jgi:hypothetical protein